MGLNRAGKAEQSEPPPESAKLLLKRASVTVVIVVSRYAACTRSTREVSAASQRQHFAICSSKTHPAKAIVVARTVGIVDTAADVDAALSLHTDKEQNN